MAGGRKIGAAYHGDAPTGCFTYFVGAEAYCPDIGENLKVWTLPAGEYLVVGFEAETFEELVTTALNKALKYSQAWQKKKGMKFADFGAEIYHPETEPGVAYMEMWSLCL